MILSLTVVRAHEKKAAEKAAQTPAESEGLPEAQEDEFFTSPLYIAMDFIAHM